jgi:hypothetical protein
VIFSERHLRHVPSYKDYYNGMRTHLSLNKDAPISRAAENTGCIIGRPILGGLHQLTVARRNRIIKFAGPAFLVAAGPAQGAHQISKRGAASQLPLAAKSGDGHAGPNIPVGLGERSKVQSASSGRLSLRCRLLAPL